MTENISANIRQQAETLAARGQVHAGYELLHRAISRGDGLTAVALADWRMSGQYIRRDLSEARQLYAEALSLGIDNAAEPYLALLASGAGAGSGEWQAVVKILQSRQSVDREARLQLAMIEAMALSANGEPLKASASDVLFQRPTIKQFPNFLTVDECEYVLHIARPRLAPAAIVDPNTGAIRPDPVRRAQCAGFPLVAEDPVLHAINRRIAAATNTQWAQGEPAQVLAYDVGEEYRLHSDALPTGENQRIITFLVALNDKFEGGATSFPAIQLHWRGRTGDGLMFGNVDDEHGAPSAAARHAGLPVRGGRKFILSRWIRERPLDLSGPLGRPF